MGQILPGLTVSFENPKGGVGKSTLTALFAGYVKSLSENGEGLSIAVVDIDDMQNTIGRMRDSEAEDGTDKSNEYEVINIGSSEFINQLDFLKENFDIILVDFPGNLKQNGVIETLHFIDVVIMPFEPRRQLISWENRSSSEACMYGRVSGREWDTARLFILRHLRVLILPR